MRSISHYIPPLIINSLRGRHICKHTHTYVLYKSNFKKSCVNLIKSLPQWFTLLEVHVNGICTNSNCKPHFFLVADTRPCILMLCTVYINLTYSMIMIISNYIAQRLSYTWYNYILSILPANSLNSSSALRKSSSSLLNTLIPFK